jgi:hypothetical protein
MSDKLKRLHLFVSRARRNRFGGKRKYLINAQHLIARRKLNFHFRFCESLSYSFCSIWLQTDIILLVFPKCLMRHRLIEDEFAFCENEAAKTFGRLVVIFPSSVFISLITCLMKLLLWVAIFLNSAEIQYNLKLLVLFFNF